MRTPRPHLPSRGALFVESGRRGNLERLGLPFLLHLRCEYFINRLNLLTSSLAAIAAQVASPSPLKRTIARQRASGTRGVGCLVLPGGGARGAYEAGVIEGIRERGGVGDGAQLPGVDLVVGTSIGAINGWFVATAQYSQLKALWHTIAAENLFQVKRQFRAIRQPSSGILTRVYEAARLSQGLTSNVAGLLDGAPVQGWLDRHIDPTTPLVVPLLFTCTNLQLHRSEIFYRLPTAAMAAERNREADRVQAVLGTRITSRELTDATVTAALAGSSATPILFDPVTITFPEGAQTYIDGGIADSAPLDIARALSTHVQLVLVEPAKPANHTYASAASIGLAAFAIAQNRLLETSLRSAYLETAGKRLFGDESLTEQQRAFFQNVFDVEIGLIRPSREITLEFDGFDDAPGIAATYEAGRIAGNSGFIPYDAGKAFA
jgi:predicted acylesterase/phospholipase RssA